MVEKEDLIIPVYLNQRVVFDLVAMLQGGIAAVTQVSQTQSEANSVTGEVSSTFGLNQALSSLLKIDFSGKAGRNAASETGETRSEQRLHTPASLFIALRALLREKRFIVNDESGAKLKPGDIVEFSAVLQRNSLLETVSSYIEFIDMMQAFIPEAPSRHSADPGKRKRKGNDALAAQQSGMQSTELTTMKQQMQSLVKALQGGNTVDLTTDALKSSHRAVITLEQQYLNDPTLADLVDGTFRVVGKLTRVICEAGEPISLNRKSAMRKLPPSMLDEMRRAFDSLDLAGFTFRPLEWEIPGPAIQVLPIAIFA